MNFGSLLEKVKDKRNKFQHTGTLNQIKFSEIKDFVQKDIDGIHIKEDVKTKTILKSLTKKTQVGTEVLKELGLI